MRVVDGKIYKDDEPVHDLGSFVCTSSEGRKRHYSGYSADVSKLPTYDNLETDSTAKCLDTGDFYYYYAPTKTWVKQ